MSLFNTRDVHGNEVASGYSSASSSDSDGDFTFDKRTLPSSTPQSDPSTSIDNSQPDTAPTSHLQSKINQALSYFDSINLKVDEFLLGFSWGDDACTRDPKIRVERTLFLRSTKLPTILQRWAVPPRQKDSSHARPVGASGTINQFALQHVCHLINKEIEDLAPYLKSPTSLDIDKETLTATSFGNLSERMQSVTPTLWQLLESLAYRVGQKEQNIHKSSLKVSIL